MWFMGRTRASGARAERLTELTVEQAEYINAPKDGPYKPDYYRY